MTVVYELFESTGRDVAISQSSGTSGGAIQYGRGTSRQGEGLVWKGALNTPCSGVAGGSKRSTSGTRIKRQSDIDLCVILCLCLLVSVILQTNVQPEVTPM
jgi:hypothetical protein